VVCDSDAAGNPTTTIRMYIDRSSNLNAFGNAFKPGGGSWSASSDARIKEVRGAYEAGLAEVAQLNPVRYCYLANDTRNPPAPGETAPYPTSNHFQVAGIEFAGLIAQEVEAIFPGMVSQHAGYLDGEPVTDLRQMDTTPLIFALVNAVKELSGRLRAAEDKIDGKVHGTQA
jgi:hypothetical protein